MRSRFTLRMQFGMDEDVEQITRELLALVRSTPVDEVMFFFFGEERNDGHDTLERVRQWIEHSRPYRRAMQDAGVAVSLNPWHSLLHCDRWRTLKPGQDWQTMVDQNGLAASAVVCPLDEGWRAYYAQTLRLYAAEDFRVIWVDDDIRLANHAPLEWGGCFCPLHVAEFNRRAGCVATREQIVAVCTAPGEPHPWREIWLDMWDDTQLELIASWRRIVEAGGSRLGLMSSAPEAHSAEGRRWAKWWEALAGDKPPIHRPHFWGYSDAPGPALIESIVLLEQNRMLQPAELECGPEVENFPYGRWNKSFRQTAAQIALGQTMGATGLNISIYDQIGNMPSDEPQRADFLRAWRPVCDWLAEEFPIGLRPVGIGIPWSEDMGRRLHTDGSGKWQSLVCPTRGWASWLGAAGHAFTMRPSGTVNAIGGPVAWCLEQEQLLRWLAGGLLLDGVAAEILVQRGLGALIGLGQARLITQADVVYSMERCTDPAFSLREGALMPINDKAYSARMLQGELLDGVRVISDLRSATNEVVGHGAFVSMNRLGGRVAVIPWTVNDGVWMNVQRAAQLDALLAFLDPENVHGAVSGGAWLVPQFLTNGKRWRGVIWNQSPDEVETLDLRAPVMMPPVSRAVQVTAAGQRLDAAVDGATVRLGRPLGQWEFVVVM